MRKIYIVIILLFAVVYKGYSQPDLPQRSATVTVTQMLDFGALTIDAGSSGGTATVDYNGVRTKSGSVLLLSMGPTAQQAIYEFKLCPGRVVTLTYPPTVTLTGNNGGSLLLHLENTSLGPSGTIFYSNQGCDDIQHISQGGTIDVGTLSSNPTGTYTGSFAITFVQQ